MITENDIMGNNILHYCVVNNNFKLFEYFLNLGLDMTITNNFGINPITYAKIFNKRKFNKYTVQNELQVNNFLTGCSVLPDVANIINISKINFETNYFYERLNNNFQVNDDNFDKLSIELYDIISSNIFISASKLAIGKQLILDDFFLRLHCSQPKPNYNLDKILEQLPTLDCEVYIGCNLPINRKKFYVGQNISFEHNLTCTANWKIALKNTPLFLDEKEQGTIFIIKSNSVRSINNFSYFPAEMEVTLPSLTNFVVSNWYRGGDQIALGQKNIRSTAYAIDNMSEYMLTNKALIIEMQQVEKL